tara:strand:- start:1068 stop:1250 length:183 start_codon:yes stop_codon:yes gene_type:complete
MGFEYDEDFSLTSGKRGGGGRKQTIEKRRPEKNKESAPTCYTAKHVRAKEALLSKKKNKN